MKTILPNGSPFHGGNFLFVTSGTDKARVHISSPYPAQFFFWGGGSFDLKCGPFQDKPEESRACRPKTLKQMDAVSCIVGDFETVFWREEISHAVVYSVTKQLVLYEYLNRNIYNAMTISTSDFVPCSAGAYPCRKEK